MDNTDVVVESENLLDDPTDRLFFRLQKIQAAYNNTLQSVLANVPTSALIDEIVKRLEVGKYMLGPDDKVSFEFDGVGVILDVCD